MIALFTVEYGIIDRDQVITFKAEILKEKHLANMTIDENEIEISILDGMLKKLSYIQPPASSYC